MKKILTAILFLTAAFVIMPSVSQPAFADEAKMVGVIERIKVAPDGKSATVILKDNKSGKDITLKIDDDLTLDKFKDHRIVEGDEIRTKYETEGDVNHSKSFLKTAGC